MDQYRYDSEVISWSVAFLAFVFVQVAKEYRACIERRGFAMPKKRKVIKP
jgi:hypothetical protein